jgi:hypothetical protein
MNSRALVFMANDRYYDWAVAFLESVRTLNATLSLHCIPYDLETTRIASLGRAFDFEMIDIDFSAFDAFADRLFPRRPAKRRNIRKYAALELELDEVAYFDIDVVLCVDPARLFGHVEAETRDLVYLSTSPGHVYRRSQMALARSLFPNMAQISAGAFVTTRKALTIGAIIDIVETHRDLYVSLRRRGQHYDQPLLNFALDCAGKITAHIGECDGGLAGMVWSRNRHIRFENGRLLEIPSGREVVAVHWAGGMKRVLELIDPRTWPLTRLRSDILTRGRHRLAALGI